VEHVSVYVDEPVARRTAGKWKVAVYLGLAVLLAAATLVAVRTADSSARSLSTRGADKADGVVPQSIGCAKTFTNPGPPAMTVCVSSHGNINQIDYTMFGQPTDHIFTEGYCLRDTGTGATYYDAGNAEAGWLAASQSSTSTTVTTTRTTNDLRFTLTQNVFFKYGSRMVLVGSLIKNNDSVARNVRFDRAFDGDINASSGGDIYDRAGASVIAKQQDALVSTLLVNPSLAVAVAVSTQGNWAASQSTCQHTFEAIPTPPGDYVGINQGGFTIAPGATVNYRIGYRLL
jgi:hypothetical protein